jgi:hypothetical protein
MVMGAVALLVVVVVLWRRGTSKDEAVSATSPSVTSMSSQLPVRQQAAPIRRVMRISPEKRMELAKQIEAARARRAASASAAAPTSGAPSSGAPTVESASEAQVAPMASAEDVLAALQAISQELRDTNTACIEQFAPGLKGFNATLTLVGDRDIGTLIDASTPVVDENGAALPGAFDDCVRAGFQSLALPPTNVGDEYSVTLTFSEDS